MSKQKRLKCISCEGTGYIKFEPPVTVSVNRKKYTFKKGQKVYIQGIYAGIVKAIYGNGIAVMPLEGVPYTQQGETFTYGYSLIKKEKYK